MIVRHHTAQFGALVALGVVTLALPLTRLLPAQQPGQSTASPSNQGTSSSPNDQKSAAKITPEQAKQLFGLVDELIRFSSQETGLPIKSDVKRQLTTRSEVEAYLESKFNEDEGAKRLQRDEIVLKKFGMLDHDFALKPFLLALLKEQIEAYYDSKTKTVNMLDWVSVDEQKSVLAHELTHALQDQHSDLEKWDDQTPVDVSIDLAGDKEHLLKDEMDTARDAVAEGQATAVMMDYLLKPLGKSLVKDPEVLDFVRSRMGASEDSPVMARAPLLLSESLMFPYREGLSFEQDIWMDQGQGAAFAGALDRPPTSSWEIINPREYEKKHLPSIPLMPNIHPLLNADYAPYDIGQMGQLDVHILSQILGGQNSASDLTPAWDGGIYWAGQLRSAKTPEELASTKSLALFYFSKWRNADSAQVFAKLYADSLGRKYSNLKSVVPAPDSNSTHNSDDEQVFSTSEGPVVITTRGKMVFVAESFSLETARKLTALMFDSQGTGATQMTQIANPQDNMSASVSSPTASLVHFMESCGVMKSAVDASIDSARGR